MYKWRTRHRLAAGWRFGFLAGNDILIIWAFRWGWTFYSRPYFN